jgi:hypothetical protein
MAKRLQAYCGTARFERRNPAAGVLACAKKRDQQTGETPVYDYIIVGGG